MIPLKFLNSGDAVNCSALMCGGSSASARLNFMRGLDFPGELLGGETTANNLAHRRFLFRHRGISILFNSTIFPVLQFVLYKLRHAVLDELSL